MPEFSLVDQFGAMRSLKSVASYDPPATLGSATIKAYRLLGLMLVFL